MASSIKKLRKKAADLVTGSNSSSAPPALTVPTTSQHELLQMLRHIDLSNELPTIRNEMHQLLNGCSSDESDVYLMDTRKGRMIEAGDKVLKSMEDTAEKIKSQAIGGEGNEDGMSRVLSGVLETVGSAHYLGVALSLIAVAMKSYRAYSSNMAQCSDLLSSMVELLDRLQHIWKELQSSDKEQEQEHLKEITRVIILGALKINSMASKSKLSRFILALINQQDLKNIQQKINLVYDSLNLTVSVLTFSNVNGPKYSNVVPSDIKTVGIKAMTKEVMDELGVGKQMGKTCVCLHAMGGAGKSTIADSVYCRLSEYQLKGYKHCKLELELRVERESIKKRQMEVFEKLTQKKSPKIGNLNEGRDILKREIEKLGCPVFLLLDNILRLEDVDYLVPHASICHPGSAILVTTRREDILQGLKSLKWEVKMKGIPFLQDEHARMLLYQSMDCSQQDVDETVRNEYEAKLLKACGGLPLALKLAGGHIQAEGLNQQHVWKWVLESLREGNSMTGDANDKELFSLKFSIDSLSPNLKEPFFDVINFYNGEEWSLDFESVVGKKELEMLVKRHLIQRKTEWAGGWLYDPFTQAITKNKTIVQVHDVLRGLGHKMMKEDSSTINITSIHEFDSSMAYDNKRHKIKGIWLKSNTVILPANLLCEMPDIRYLVNAKVEGECTQLLESLKKCHLLSHKSRLPFSLDKAKSLKSLKACNIDVSGVQLPKNLKFLSLTSDCIKNLQQFEVCNLEVLELEYCSNLESMDGIVNLHSLKHLKVLFCKKVMKVDIEGCCLEGLTIKSCDNMKQIKFYDGYSRIHHLHVSRCRNLTTLPHNLSCQQNLKHVSLDHCNELSQLPDGFLKACPNLTSLSLDRCLNLSQLPDGFLNACSNLTSLSLDRCSKVSQLPDGFLKSCPNLTSLRLYECLNLSQLPNGFLNANSNLTNLSLDRCSKVSQLPGGFLNACHNIIDLHLDGCSKLSQLPDGFLNACPNLTNLSLDGCSNLSHLPDGFLKSCPNLTSLRLYECSNLSQLPNGFLNACPNLTYLCLIECSNLSQFPNDFLSTCPNLTGLPLHRCSKLSQLPNGFLNRCTKLTYLSLNECSNLFLLPDSFLNDSPNLTNLSLYECSNLSQLPDGFLKDCPNLTHLSLHGCSNLSQFPNGFLNTCSKLTNMSLDDVSSNLSHLPDGFLNACRNLTSLSLYRCSNISQLLYVFLDACPSLTSLSLFGCLNSQLPDGFLNICANLSTLDLYACSNHSQLPYGFLNTCQSIESLSFIGWPNLYQIPNCFLNSFPNLTRLNLHECSNLSRLSNSFPNACPKLAKITLEKCLNLSQLPDSFLNTCLNLTSLILNKCWNLSQLPVGFLDACPNLRVLHLRECRRLSKLPYCFLNACPNLTGLNLSGCSMLSKLPYGFLKACSNLQMLNLSRCSKLSQLPDGFLNAWPNLKTLSLYGCPNLSQLPDDFLNACPNLDAPSLYQLSLKRSSLKLLEWFSPSLANLEYDGWVDSESWLGYWSSTQPKPA